MNKILSAAVAALLLSACNQPAAPASAEPAASEAPMSAESAAPAAETAAPAAQVQAPDAAAVPDASAAPAAPAASAAGDQAINDSIDNVLGDHAQYQAAITQFQQAVATRDAAAVAALVDYPFTATIDGNKVVVKDTGAFAAQYDKIVTPAIADVIVKQKYAELMVNAKGVMFGSGEAWLNGVCKDKACKAFDVKVVTIQPGA